MSPVPIFKVVVMLTNTIFNRRSTTLSHKPPSSWVQHSEFTYIYHHFFDQATEYFFFGLTLLLWTFIHNMCYPTNKVYFFPNSLSNYLFIDFVQSLFTSIFCLIISYVTDLQLLDFVQSLFTSIFCLIISIYNEQLQ